MTQREDSQRSSQALGGHRYLGAAQVAAHGGDTSRIARAWRRMSPVPMFLALAGMFVVIPAPFAPAGTTAEEQTAAVKAPTEEEMDLALAMAHAPIHYQDTDATNARADYLAAFSYDSNWHGEDNWENLEFWHQYAHVYYSVVETCTHFFISYAFYHPRDWWDFEPIYQPEGQHENDMEDAIAIVRKGVGPMGTLQALVTQAHGNYFIYLPEGSPLTVEEGQEIRGTLPMAEYPVGSGLLHPETTQETQGHGLGAKGGIGDFHGQDDNDGIIYFPSRSAERPESGNDRNVAYNLESFFEPDGLWDRQLAEDFEPGPTYYDWGTLRGDDEGGCDYAPGTEDCKLDAAGPPWGQNDASDDGSDVGEIREGEIVLDPAHFADGYFDGFDDLHDEYVQNQYIVDLEQHGVVPNAYNGPALVPAFFHKILGVDGDADGLHSCDERDVHRTDPRLPDTDGDGFSDGDEVEAEADPTDPASHPNRIPTAADDAYSMLAGEQLPVAAPGVLGNDSDPDGDPLTAALESGPAHGTLTLDADGSFTYTSNEDFSGTDSFIYRASDGGSTSDEATVTVTVAAACGGRTPTLIGTAGDDKLTGTSGPDVIWGLGGNDKLLGQGGDDVMCGGSGNDDVNSNSGNDMLYGDSGVDILRGDLGNDTLNGGSGIPDTCHGDKGNDTATNCERVTGVP